jgi:hypothetical protein
MKRTLVQQLERNLRRDPLDGPVVDVQADVAAAQELGWELDWADARLIRSDVQPHAVESPSWRVSGRS